MLTYFHAGAPGGVIAFVGGGLAAVVFIIVLLVVIVVLVTIICVKKRKTNMNGMIFDSKQLLNSKFQL